MKEHLKYLYNNFDLLSDQENRYLKNIIIQIINKESELEEIEKKLLLKYAIKQKCLYHKYPLVKVEFIEANDAEEDLKSAGGWYDSSKQTIFITSNTLNDTTKDYEWHPFYSKYTTPLERMLLSALHECEHYFQHYDCANNNLTIRAYYWTIFKITTLNDKKEYNKNYLYKQIENQANLNGWRDVGTFLASHQYKKRIELHPFLQSSARQELSHQKSEKSTLIEYYNIEQLIKKCKERPKLVFDYPILQEFFISRGNQVGDLKNTSLLVEQYNKLPRHHISSQEKQTIYREFFYYLFSNDPSKITQNSYLIILDMIEHDLISLGGIFDHINSRINEKRNVINRKIDRIILFYETIEKLGLLDEYDTNSPYDHDYSHCIRNIIFSRLQETLKVYETSKAMYDNYDEEIEKTVNKLRVKFNFYDIEVRDLEARKSALNI